MMVIFCVAFNSFFPFFPFFGACLHPCLHGLREESCLQPIYRSLSLPADLRADASLQPACRL